MTDQSSDELRDRLRAVDPAGSLPPADPTGVARLLEDVMNTELTTENRATGTRQRGPLTWLVAAAAAVVIAGVGIFAVLGQDDDPVAPPVAKGETGVTELAAPDAGAYDAKCMVPNPEIVAQQSVAFSGTVTTIADGTVTLDVDHWYAGGTSDEVRVEAPAADLNQLVSAVDFEEGGRYLVSATDGQVTVCGFSAPYSAELAAIYQQAFPG